MQITFCLFAMALFLVISSYAKEKGYNKMFIESIAYTFLFGILGLLYALDRRY